MLSRVVPVALAVLLSVAAVASQTADLTVVNTGPTGELQQLQQANEIRVVFSEPMVPLGRIPSNPTPPWIRITPALAGTFRWSGTTILIFTPDRTTPVPYATRYRVTIDTTAESVAGRRLRAPYEFSFTTPTVRLGALHWARRNNRVNDPVTIALTFNQAVRPADVLAHLIVRFRPHQFDAPDVTTADRARMLATEPDGLRQFDIKLAEARRNAARTDRVAVRLATDWDRVKFRDLPGRVMLETTSPVPPGTVLEFVIDAQIPAAQGREVPGSAQTTQAEMEKTLFAQVSNCRVECESSNYNALHFSERVHTSQFASALSVKDVTDPARETVVSKTNPVRASSRDASEFHSAEDAGFDRQPAARTWAFRMDPSMQSEDGQTLGYPATLIVENGNDRAFVGFGDGHGVWEKGSGALLPYYARNFQTVIERATRLSPTELVPRLLALEKAEFRMTPPGAGTTRRLTMTPNRIQSYGLDLTSPLGAARTGLFWAGLQPGEPIARARATRRETSSLIQVTNLGISVKDSPQSTLVFVARLDNGEAVPGATVSIVNTSNVVVWKGTTGKDGVAMAPALPVRKPTEQWVMAFVVLAEKDGDVAYVCSDWNEGIMPWDFDTSYDVWQATDILRGSVFTDRGVYKAGESVQIKAIVRTDTPSGVRLLPSGSNVLIVVRDARNKEVDRRTVTLNRWSSAEWSWSVPQDAPLGHYGIEGWLAGTEPKETNDATPFEPDARWQKRIGGSFLVAAYRRPDFSVNATVTTGTPFAGAALAGSTTATYLFGGTMARRPVKWSVTRAVESSPLPGAVLEKFPAENYTFSYSPDRRAREETRIAGGDALLNASGALSVSVPTDRAVDLPYRYTFETDIEDLSRQHIASRASVVLHPAAIYLGARRPEQFPTANKPSEVQIVAVDLNGAAVPGVAVTVSLFRQQWNSIRHAQGSGFYEWDVERLEIPAGQWTVTTAAKPVPFPIVMPEGGSYVLRLTAKDRDGRGARTDLGLYSTGEGYTAWERYDHNRITLEPERKTWKPGQTARILIKSPWERATALLTTEREGIRQYRRFTLTSTQQTIDVPITAADIPNVYVSVLLVRGRTSADIGADGSDPGKPAFRLGYTELLVADDTKRLSVKVTADREEYRPATSAKVSVSVNDATGKGAASEVTLWAVDQGVLALTEYQPPDVASAIYVRKSLQVMNEDSRQRIVSRRVLTPKGDGEGGGGGAEMNARKDFRPLAFWLGSVETDRSGRATRSVTLPDSLTSYTILAVAGDAASRFGTASAGIRVTKPITLLPILPRFLALADRASFGALVSNTQKSATDAVVTIRSLDPALLEFQGGTESAQHLNAGATAAVRFDAIARGVGPARVRVSVTAGRNTDAFEMTVPVGAPARMETTAAFGDTVDRSVERLSIPRGVLPASGELSVELASSALVGLGEGARYLADYPYWCAEQKASAALALTLAADLRTAFSMGKIAPADYRARAQGFLDELPKYQCSDGGFGYWPERCLMGNFYLTGYVMHVLRVAGGLGMKTGGIDTAGALAFLEKELRAEPPALPQWIPAWGASASYAVRELVAYGQNQDGNITRLVTRIDSLPVFALSFLADGMIGPGNTRHPRYADVLRRIMNGVRIEGDRAHVEELDNDALLWLWNSNVRSSAIVLEGLARRADDPRSIAGLVRGLLLARVNGRWRNTQENAMALEALVGYYRKFEAEEPNLSATVAVGTQTIGSATFRGRSSASQVVRLAMPDLLRQVAAGTEADLAISRAGTGRLYYTARLQYTPSTPSPVSDQGIRIDRQYARISDSGDGAASTTFAAGDLIRVTLALTLPKERRYVAVTDPLAAGFEAVDAWFRTTASDLAKDASSQPTDGSFLSWYRHGGFDYVQKFDDRVALFATRLSEGRHEFSYIVRATTAGTFSAGGTWAEEMYAPEVNGRSAPVTVIVK